MEIGRPQGTFLGRKSLTLSAFVWKNLEEICKYFLTYSASFSIIVV